MRNRNGLRDGSGPRKDCPRKDGAGSGNAGRPGPRRDGTGPGPKNGRFGPGRGRNKR